jgi:hypothetical protein
VVKIHRPWGRNEFWKPQEGFFLSQEPLSLLLRKIQLITRLTAHTSLIQHPPDARNLSGAPRQIKDAMLFARIILHSEFCILHFLCRTATKKKATAFDAVALNVQLLFDCVNANLFAILAHTLKLNLTVDESEK